MENALSWKMLRRYLPAFRTQHVVFLVLLLAMCGSAARGDTNCSISQATYDADSHYMSQGSPTHLNLMVSRYVELLRAARGLSCTGVPLLAFNGLDYGPAVWADAPGPCC